MKTILVTGGNGFIGKKLIESLLENYLVVVFAKNPIQTSFENHDNFKFEKGDIIDSNHTNQIISKYTPSIVIHLASLTGISKCENQPFDSFLTNVFGTFNVIQGCVKNNSKLIFLSSREVYGDTRGELTKEDDRKIPNNVYGLTKLEAENLILWAHKKFNLNYTILRPTNIYGPGGDKYGVQVIIQKLLHNETIFVMGGEQKMNFIFIEDIISAISECISNKNSINQIFNLGSNENLSINELINLLEKISGKYPILEFTNIRKGETMNFKPSINKINMILGWKPFTNLSDGLISTIDTYN